MTISILNAQTEKSMQQHYAGQILLFLYDLTCDYPFFGEWLKKALSEIRDGKRQVVLLTDESKPLRVIGLTILKTYLYEKKICTIRVAKDYQRQGYGTELVKKSLKILNTDHPLATVSEKHIDAFKPFFKQFGFHIASKVKSIYHEGDYEYFFNVPYEHRNVLMSIKPKYANAIFNGSKRVEFRKSCFAETVTRVYVYSSAPVKRIIGFFSVEKIDKDAPQKLWERFEKVGGIQQEDFMSYFSGLEEGYAIVVKDVELLENNLTVAEVFGRNYTVPQNYRYIDNVEILHVLETR